ncbi:PTS fructose transporter subunit IIA [Thiohalobacter sp. IOR34]|uniref:PTS sugar transporter subunit IIA n=1 Tax=Thiohalobacter sp. IOR34 TaxID=3057176 RepID=UPI0025B254D6|nr:PTS fructose transporter subunit IIA [Thiohalobacter sp. IOR34]WJW74864.1 PTS fructose transporter subunit IIA [Thiohalobacter sp. IOR34]
MSIGLLIITHGRIGDDLLHTATQMLGLCPLATRTLPVGFDCDPDLTLQEAIQAVQALDDGEGVLVLTDMYGSTPSNIANRIHCHAAVAVVAGINLPMLVRVLNYPRLSLEDMVEKALSGGRDGVVLCCPPAGHD